MARSALLRPSGEIEAARSAAKAWLPSTREKDFVRGAVAAYDWLLGLCVAAPASGDACLPGYDAVLHEERVADDVAYGRSGAPDLSLGWAVGVATALMWARAVDGVAAPGAE